MTMWRGESSASSSCTSTSISNFTVCSSKSMAARQLLWLIVVSPEKSLCLRRRAYESGERRYQKGKRKRSSLTRIRMMGECFYSTRLVMTPLHFSALSTSLSHSSDALSCSSLSLSHSLPFFLALLLPFLISCSSASLYSDSSFAISFTILCHLLALSPMFLL